MHVIKRMPEFDHWHDHLRDRATKIRLLRRLEKAQRGLLGDITHDDVAEYLSQVLEEGDSGELASALGHISKARGMTGSDSSNFICG